MKKTIQWVALSVLLKQKANSQSYNIGSVNKKNSRLISNRNQLGVSYAPENRQLTVDKWFSSLSLLSQRFQGFFLFLNRKILNQASGILCTKFGHFGGQNLVQNRWGMWRASPLPDPSVDLKTPAAPCTKNRVRQAFFVFSGASVISPLMREICRRTRRSPRCKSMSSHLRPRSSPCLNPVASSR